VAVYLLPRGTLFFCLEHPSNGVFLALSCGWNCEFLEKHFVVPCAFSFFNKEVALSFSVFTSSLERVHPEGEGATTLVALRPDGHPYVSFSFWVSTSFLLSVTIFFFPCVVVPALKDCAHFPSEYQPRSSLPFARRSSMFAPLFPQSVVFPFQHRAVVFRCARLGPSLLSRASQDPFFFFC